MPLFSSAPPLPQQGRKIAAVLPAGNATLSSVVPASGTAIGVNAPAQQVNFAGGSTAWAAITNVPTITLDATTLANGGVLGAIIVDSPTTAHAQLTAPNAANPITFTDVTDNNTTASLQCYVVATAPTFSGPAGGVVTAPSTNFTLALLANQVLNADTVVTLSDGGGGATGTFTPATVTFLKNTPADSHTCTYTPLTVGAKTLTPTGAGLVFNPTTLTYTPTDSLAVGAITVTAQNPTSISLSITPSGGAGGNSAVWGRWTSQVDAHAQTTGTRTVVPGSGNTVTDSTPVPGTVYYYNVVVTDAALDSVWATLEKPASTQGVDTLCIIGDSIPRYTGGGQTAPSAYLGQIYPRYQGGRAVTILDQSHDGAQLSDWNSGGAYDVAAVAAFGAPSASKFVHIMLGTNDSRQATGGAGGGSDASNDRSTAFYSSRMTTLVTLWAVTRGFKVVLHFPPYMWSEGAGFAFVAHGADDRLFTYLGVLKALANNSTVFLGDTTAFAAFAASAGTGGGDYNSGSDQLHPSTAGAQVLAEAWAMAQAKVDGLIASGGGGQALIS